MPDDNQEHTGGTQPTPEMVGGVAPQGEPPGSAAPGGPMDTGPNAGAGPGGPEDIDPGIVAAGLERGPEGPIGGQDSSGGDLAEAGDDDG